MTSDRTKEKLYYYLPGDPQKHVIEVEWDESGKSKKTRCLLNPGPYDDFSIDEITLLGKCGDPFCHQTIQFFREPVRPDIPPEIKKTPHKAKVNHQDGEGSKASKTWRKNKPESPAVEAEQEPKEEIEEEIPEPEQSTDLHFPPLQLADLRKGSGLDDDTIREAEIYPVVPGDILKIFNHPKIESMLAFPYLGTDHVRYKTFSSEPILDKDGHEIKYYQPKGSSNRLYILKSVRAILADPSVPLHITEGEKKTLKMNQEGLPCVGLGGLWSWSDGSEEKRLIPDFDKINFKGRTVCLVPDNDWLKPDRHGERKNLRQAVYELAYRLIDLGARVYIVYLPDGPEKGVDDYLCNHTVDEFKSLRKEEVKKYSLDEMIKQATLENLPEILKRMANLKETERAVYINALSKKLDIPKRSIQKDLQDLLHKKEDHPDIERLLDDGANPESNYSAQNFIDGVLSYGAILGKEKVLVQSDGQIILADGSGGDSFRFKRSALTAETIKRFRAGEDVDGKNLLNRIQTLFADHVIFRDSRIPTLLAVWVLGTYFFKVFRYYGYLWVNSFVKRCGKSLLLDILSMLCFNATSRLLDPSPSFLFRETDSNDGTLILDEIERLGGADKEQRKEIIALLNGGFQSKGQAPRMELRNREFVVTYFNVYSPKVLAGIKSIVDTIEDRSFKIPMARKRKSEAVKRFNPRVLDSPVERIREDCFLWALKYAGDVSDFYNEISDTLFPGIQCLDDRFRDVLEPLLSIGSVLDTLRDDGTVRTVNTLTNLARDMAKGREDQEELTGSISAVVNLMKTVIDGIEERFISADDLFSKFQADDDLNFIQSKRSLAFFLAKMDLHRTLPRWVKGKTVRGYVVNRKWVEDLEARYV